MFRLPCWLFFLLRFLVFYPKKRGGQEIRAPPPSPEPLPQIPPPDAPLTCSVFKLPLTRHSSLLISFDSSKSADDLSGPPDRHLSPVLLLPPWVGCWSIAARVLPGTWVERGTLRIKCLAQEHNTISLSQGLNTDYSIWRAQGSKDGAVVRALASHQCVPGSIRGPGVISGLSVLLVLYSAPRGFSPGIPIFPCPKKSTFPNAISILECVSISERVLVNSWCSMGKQITKLHY